MFSYAHVQCPMWEEVLPERLVGCSPTHGDERLLKCQVASDLLGGGSYGRRRTPPSPKTFPGWLLISRCGLCECRGGTYETQQGEMIVQPNLESLMLTSIEAQGQNDWTYDHEEDGNGQKTWLIAEQHDE